MGTRTIATYIGSCTADIEVHNILADLNTSLVVQGKLWKGNEKDDKDKVEMMLIMRMKRIMILWKLKRVMRLRMLR